MKQAIDLKALQKLAVLAAQTAGAYILSQAKENFQLLHKEAGSSLASQVLTRVDLESQNLILDLLAPSIQEYDLALLTEETEDDKSRLEKDYFWCIDPLDGTLAFINGQAGYNVSIALVAKDGTPILSALYNPIDKTTFTALKGEGIRKNAQSFIAPKQQEGTTLHLFFDQSFLEQTYFQDCLQAIKQRTNKPIEIHTQGGAVMHACNVLEHPHAAYFKFPKKLDGCGSLWDYAATACLFNEIPALQVSDIHGAILDLNRPDGVFMNHKGILYATSADIAQMIQEVYRSLV